MLLDVGVWLAAVWSGHARHRRVATSFTRCNGELVLRSAAQMGLLRLLSNPAVLDRDTLTRAAAWQLIDRLRADERIRWAGEPAQLEQAWRAISARDDTRSTLWTDDYLAAFAQTAGLGLVTLDTGFHRRYPSVTVTVVA
jgi:toxin-antitoxin system PIN domain toxin